MKFNSAANGKTKMWNISKRENRKRKKICDSCLMSYICRLLFRLYCLPSFWAHFWALLWNSPCNSETAQDNEDLELSEIQKLILSLRCTWWARAAAGWLEGRFCIMSAQHNCRDTIYLDWQQVNLGVKTVNIIFWQEMHDTMGTVIPSHIRHNPMSNGACMLFRSTYEEHNHYYSTIE